MKRIFTVINLALLFLLLSAEQCTESRDSQVRETILEQRIKGIITHFETDYLSDSMLFEYEKNAGLKLSDLKDLLKILGDASKELSFRKKAGDMILKSFISEQCCVKFLSDPVSEGSIGSVVLSGLDHDISFHKWDIDSVRTNKPFTRTGENTYQTSLGFTQSADALAPGSRKPRRIRNEIEVVINREVKVLGNDSLWVWVLQFGNMK